MVSLDMVKKLGNIIEQEIKDENFERAIELSHIQMELIEERSKTWNTGFMMAMSINDRGKQIRKSTSTKIRKN